MTIFTRLPIITPGSGYTIPQSDVALFAGTQSIAVEPESADHWIFNKASDSNLIGLNNLTQLTKQGVSPTYESNYLSLNPSPGNALLTPTVEVANQVGTVACVFKAPATWTSFHFLFGTLSTGTGNSFGGTAYLSSAPSAFPRTINLNDRGMSPASSDNVFSLQASEWYFFAQSRDFNSVTKKRISLLGGQNALDQTLTGTFSAATGRRIALGNGYYTGTYSPNMDYAELIMFDRALTASELQSLYLRRKEAMALNGIAVA